MADCLVQYSAALMAVMLAESKGVLLAEAKVEKKAVKWVVL